MPPAKTIIRLVGIDRGYANFAEFLFRDCMKSPQAPARRLVMRRTMAAYTNASPLAHSLS
jgi:hypothetical protein